MASVVEFSVTGDHVAARDVVLNAVSAAGFTAVADGTWKYQLSRGNKTTTFWLGAMAGKNFHLTFVLDFSVDDSGAFVARLSRDVMGSALRGGAIGASVASTEFQLLLDSVGTTTTQAGIYAATRTVS
jgi:hypothetical protein